MKTIASAVAVTAGSIILAVGIGAFVFLEPDPEPAPLPTVHYHAGFQIYVDGRLRDFSALEFMEITPCGDDDIHEEDTVDLHNGVGRVIHVHHRDMTWQNVIEYVNERREHSVDISEKRVQGFVNGEEVEDILSYPITAYDSVVIVVGDARKEAEPAVTVEEIKEAEASQEGCGI